MKESFRASAGISAGVLIGLLGLQEAGSSLPDRGASRYVRHVVAMAAGRDNRRHLNAGYYEALLQGKDEETVAKTLLTMVRGKKQNSSRWSDLYMDDNFLRYELKPGINLIDPMEGPLKSNRQGLLSDHEYALEKPAATRRIALLGDSIAWGQGVRKDLCFGNVLESLLNAEAAGNTKERFEVLNFAIRGYRLTQLYDVAVHKAAAFHPDVYLLTLTELDLRQIWSEHLIELVRKDIDLKYDFLRDFVRAAKIQKDDDPDVMAAKLAPGRIQLIQDILARLKSHADRNGAMLIVVLVPSAEDEELIRRRFKRIPERIAETGVTTVNLLDTFGNIPNIETMRTTWWDGHPNAEGHRLLAENLYRQLAGNPNRHQTTSLNPLKGHSSAGRFPIFSR